MLEGKDASLRAIEQQDIPYLLKWRNNPDFRKFFREYRELNMAQQQHWFENVVLTDDRVRMFAIVEKADHRLIGACGLCYIDWVNRSADLSIYIGADDLYIDEQLAPDAATLMIDYGFSELGLHRLWAEIYDFDERKKKLFAELGFSLDGRHRQAHWGGGAWHDSLFYGLLCSEWEYSC